MKPRAEHFSILPSQEELTGFICTAETCIPERIDEGLRAQIAEALKGKPLRFDEVFPPATPEK